MSYGKHYFKDTGAGEGDEKLVAADCLLKFFAKARQKNLYKLHLDINKRSRASQAFSGPYLGYGDSPWGGDKGS